MKLLLTSGGITNKSMSDALLDMTGKPFTELNLAFIPTAANVEKGDKDWFIKDLIICKDLGFKQIDIVDISALPKDVWESRLKEADVLLFEGGNTHYLMHWIEKSGLKDILEDLLETRVYIGISAGSIVCAPNLSTSSSKDYYEGEEGDEKEKEGLGYVNFHIRPHLNSPHFPNINEENLKEIAEEIKEPMYAIDDQTAIKAADGKVEIISEGEYLKYNFEDKK